MSDYKSREKEKAEYKEWLKTLSSSERTKRLRYMRDIEERGYSHI